MNTRTRTHATCWLRHFESSVEICSFSPYSGSCQERKRAGQPQASSFSRARDGSSPRWLSTQHHPKAHRNGLCLRQAKDQSDQRNAVHQHWCMQCAHVPCCVQGCPISLVASPAPTHHVHGTSSHAPSWEFATAPLPLQSPPGEKEAESFRLAAGRDHDHDSPSDACPLNRLHRQKDWTRGWQPAPDGRPPRPAPPSLHQGIRAIVAVSCLIYAYGYTWVVCQAKIAGKECRSAGLGAIETKASKRLATRRLVQM